MNITVYLGAFEGNDPALGNAVRELGTWIGESGNSLIYGGSKSGLMGQIAESVLNAGGKVTGVEPQFFIDSEPDIFHQELPAIVPDMNPSNQPKVVLQHPDFHLLSVSCPSYLYFL